MNLHPRRCSQLTLMPSQARPTRRKRPSRNPKCLRQAKRRTRQKNRRKCLRLAHLNQNAKVGPENRAGGAAGDEAGGEEVGRGPPGPRPRVELHPLHPNLLPKVIQRRR